MVHQLKMPRVDRPILVADSDGLWLAPAVNSLGAHGAVYHVALGATSATAVFPLAGPQYVAWMVAEEHSVWLDVTPGTASGTLWRLDGSRAARSGHVTVASFSDDVEVQGGSPAMVGDASEGLWTAIASGTEQQILRVNATSGTPTAIATVKPGYSSPNTLTYGNQWQAVTLDGSMYLLDPPTESGYPNGQEGFSALYRVTPPG